MRKKTIGEVLRLARINQELSLEDLQEKTDIQLAFLEAMEADEFDTLPSTFYARSFLRKYAWAVDLDERIILDAYEDGSMIVYDEIDINMDEDFRSRKRRKKRNSFLPLFYFSLVAMAILAFVTIYVWNYTQRPSNQNREQSYQIVSQEEQSSMSSTSSSQSEASSSSEPKASLEVTGEGSNLTARLTGVSTQAKLELSVKEVTSWVSVAGTSLENGVTLSPESKSAATELTSGGTYLVTLGVVRGVEVLVDGQQLDTSALTDYAGTITITVENKGSES
ncbi:cytoskeleton protein RodZ [Streptococcus himalayensis]|uniref:DNA-binding protein n=1 Tax=Streptococcus himalayensis TaxID=1888195 RepID=A0A917A3Z8_9STRE|nr:cytoskeleton protein RodZ [Streptococcus himalayensis]GGE23907.1 DNA-binding protein [Streptococcus himalayensis]